MINPQPIEESFDDFDEAERELYHTKVVFGLYGFLSIVYIVKFR